MGLNMRLLHLDDDIVSKSTSISYGAGPSVGAALAAEGTAEYDHGETVRCELLRIRRFPIDANSRTVIGQ
jgi:hypothetical protein